MLDSIIDRADVPAGSFRYGQLASIKSFDVPADRWAICTRAAKCKNEADNGKSGFDTVLVCHFTADREEDAMETVASMPKTHVVLVRPA